GCPSMKTRVNCPLSWKVRPRFLRNSTRPLHLKGFHPLKGLLLIVFTLSLAPPSWSSPIEDQLLKMADDPDARVRFQAALSLGSIESDRKDSALARIAIQDADDKWVRTA